jgi:pSer/pThr/pTyr-binding forkhead associated (FHA) protein
VGITLRCTAGPSAGESITIDDQLVLGRDQSTAGRLGGDPRLSRRHARVFIDEQGHAMVEDLGSTNGTWLNGAQLADARALANGDELRTGQTTFVVELPAPPVLTRPDTAIPGVTATVLDAPPPRPRLLVLSGPKEGEEIRLADELLIGRGYGEPGALGGDRMLSRRHARVARGSGGVFFLQDTGSTNGTMLNGVLVRHAQALSDGDVIQLGSSRLQAQGCPRASMAVEPDHQPGAPVPASDALAAGPLAVPRHAGPGAALDPEHAGAGDFVPRGAAGARLSSRRVIAAFAVVFAAAAIIAVVVVVVAAPLGSRACPQGFVCHAPPTAAPLRALTTFTGALGWRIEYDRQMATPASASAGSNQLVLQDTAAWDRLVGQTPGSGVIAVLVRAFRSSQTSPQQAIQTIAGDIGSHLLGAADAPSSDQMFGQPVLGFHPAQGEVLEGSQRTPQGPGGLVKVAVLSASSGGVTIGAAVVYPVQRSQTQGSNPDRPYDGFGDQILETVRFPSDGAT